MFPILIGMIAYNLYSAATIAYDSYRTVKRLHKVYKTGLKRPPWKWAYKKLKRLEKNKKEFEEELEDFEENMKELGEDLSGENDEERFWLWRCKFPKLRKQIEDYFTYNYWFGSDKASQDKDGWKKEDNDDFVGVLILMGITYLSFLVSIIELALHLMFYLVYVKDVQNKARMLKNWLVARFFCFIFSICVVILYILAILKTPKDFADIWQLYVGLGVFLIIFALGIVTAVLAILRIHSHNKEVIRNQRGSIIPWALGK